MRPCCRLRLPSFVFTLIRALCQCVGYCTHVPHVASPPSTPIDVAKRVLLRVLQGMP